jgi:hypothetical protein
VTLTACKVLKELVLTLGSETSEPIFEACVYFVSCVKCLSLFLTFLSIYLQIVNIFV